MGKIAKTNIRQHLYSRKPYYKGDDKNDGTKKIRLLRKSFLQVAETIIFKIFERIT